MVESPSDPSTLIPVVIAITVNGEVRQIPAGLSIAGLIDSLGHHGRRIAVERNGEIVPRSEHPHTELAAGDRLEVVVAVGGG
ncbi:sulfur carrier protein ThiS [Chitinimonas lacunae]|uniref:Sulfur carrier protein ThiS n=1 Tax=Chitinimonas lacunae TaxID=1963018 RepID=A0ABV8MPP4_9NEIS